MSGLVNGTDLSADGLTITVAQSPYATMLDTAVRKCRKTVRFI